MFKSTLLKIACAAGILIGGAASAQVQSVDPNAALQEQPQGSWESEYQPIDEQRADEAPAAAGDPAADPASEPVAGTASQRASASAGNSTVPREDVFTAAEGVFGKGAEGLANLIEDLLRDQGEPSAYITGREAGGAFVAGVRYGSGTLHHGIEGDRPVYWTGPSLGFDFGADANKVFVLVYNLHDSEKIFKRYPAAEGNAYVVGGFTASYLRRGDVVLIPVRMGVGLRLGVNAGYMRFSQKNRWLPF
jgi:hypothetical protein